VRQGGRIRRRRRVIGAAAAVAVVAIAIPVAQHVDVSSGQPTGPSSQPNSVSPRPSHPTSTGRTTSPAPPPTTPVERWGFNPRTSSTTPAGTPLVLDVRTGTHPIFDRVVIDLSRNMPGYRVEYVDQLIGPASGAPIDALAGAGAYLQVTLTPASTHNVRTGAPLFQGPTTQEVDMPALRGWTLIEDYEGTVTFGIALDARSRFNAFELTEPNRMVIDIHH
jgi:hypothetical protein